MNQMPKALTLLLSLLAALACLALPAAAQQELIIRVTRLAGTVEVVHPEQTAGEWTGASLGQELTAGWTLRTVAGSKVQLTFPLDNIVILKENSVLYVEDLDYGGDATVATDSGGILFDLRNALSPGSEFEVKTPSALAVVRGTKFGVENPVYSDPGTNGNNPLYELSAPGSGGGTGGGTTFYGYEGEVEVYNDFGSSLLTPGTTVFAVAGEPPSEPQPSGPDAGDFVSEAEDQSAYDEYAAVLADALALLEDERDTARETSRIILNLVNELEQYERRDEVAKAITLYAQLLNYMQVADGRTEEFLEALVEVQDDAGIGTPPVDVPQESGSELGGDAFTDLAEALAGSWNIPDGLPQLAPPASEGADFYAEAYIGFGRISEDMEPLIDGHEETLDRLRGLIYETDPRPELGLRWDIFDTDNDGLSDLEEELLGTDPYSDDSAEGFIKLENPADSARFSFPDDEEVEFHFTALDSDYVDNYTLVLEAGGRRWFEADVDERTDVGLELLAGPGGVFTELATGTGGIELSWYVFAEVDEAALVDELGNRGGGGFGGRIASETRTLTIEIEQVDQEAVIDLYAVGATGLVVGDQLRIEAEISEITGLGQFEIEVSYDPTLLEFDRGRKLGDFSTSTLFFSDSLGGLLTISGSLAPGAPDPVEGVIFELTFAAAEDGEGFVEVSDARLLDTLEREIDAEGGDEVEYTITGGQGFSDAPPGQHPRANYDSKRQR